MVTSVIRNNWLSRKQVRFAGGGLFFVSFFFFYEIIVYLCTQIAKNNNE